MEPLNPLKKKHRGRICKVTGFRQGRWACVVFLDNARRGRVELEELVLFDENTPDFAEATKHLTVERLLNRGKWPDRDHPDVRRNLEKWVASGCPPETDDKPNYLEEAYLAAHGLMHAVDAVAAHGELLLAHDKVKKRIVDGTVAAYRPGMTPEALELAIKPIAQAAMDEFEAAVADMRRRYGFADPSASPTPS